MPRRIKRRKKIWDNDLLDRRDRPDYHDRPNVLDEYAKFLKDYGLRASLGEGGGGVKVAERGESGAAGWYDGQGLRLDAKPYLSGAFATRKLLERLPVEKVPLKEVTAGHAGGLYNGPQFRRIYLTHPEHSVPFVGSKDMLVADLSTLPRLRKTDAESSQLSYLKLEPGMTLISCSGFNAGRRCTSVRTWPVTGPPGRAQSRTGSRADRAGYLQAFLASRFGEALVRGSVYGSAVRHRAAPHRGSAGAAPSARPWRRRSTSWCRRRPSCGPSSRRGSIRRRGTCSVRLGLEDLLDMRWHEQGRDLGSSAEWAYGDDVAGAEFSAAGSEGRGAVENRRACDVGGGVREGHAGPGVRLSASTLSLAVALCG